MPMREPPKVKAPAIFIGIPVRSKKRHGLQKLHCLAGMLAVASLMGLAEIISAAQQAASEETVKKPAVESGAIAALEKMGASLRALKAFTVRADTITDEVLDTGQKIQFGGVVELRVRRPNRFRADVSSDRKQRQLFYDGKTVTLYAQKVGYYASFNAPPTVRETLEVADQRFGLQMPLADLLYWGTDKARIEDIKSATLIGASRVAGVECDHYAFHQDDVDWQIWIEKGKSALPRKLVITTLDEKEQPQHIAVLHWNIAPKLDDSMFRFVPTKDARRIVIAPVEKPAASQK